MISYALPSLFCQKKLKIEFFKLNQQTHYCQQELKIFFPLKLGYKKLNLFVISAIRFNHENLSTKYVDHFGLNISTVFLCYNHEFVIRGHP